MNSFRLSFFLKSILPFVFCICFSQLAFAQIDFEIIDGDVTKCANETVSLSIDASVDSIIWSPAASLSMPNALSTLANPTVSTTYTATLFSDSLTQVVTIQVDVFSQAFLGNDDTVCSNGGSLDFDFSDLPVPGTYVLSSDGGFLITESPDNVFVVDVNGADAGTFDLIVTNPDCDQADTIQVTVVDGVAAELDLQEEDRAICIGDEVTLSAAAVAGQTYTWTGNGVLLSSTNTVINTPTVTTTYVISATGTTCTVPSQDSVTITVSNFPNITLPEEMMGCENDTIQLGNNIAQAGTTYSWEPTENIVDPTAVNAQLFVVEDQTYILTADNGCVIMDTIEVTLIPNNIMLQDTIFVCQGDEVTIPFTTNPANDDVVFTTIDGAPLINVPVPFTLTPDDVVSFIATVENDVCVFTDTVTLQVDSLPMNIDLSFMEFNDAPAPICVGDTVIITSTTFDETFFPNIEYQWLSAGNIPGQNSEFLTPDTLFNIILEAEETRVYSRIATNGACIDTVEVEVPVVPILTILVTPVLEICPNTSVMLTGTAFDPINNEDIDPAEIEWEWMLMPGTIEPAEGLGENTPTATVESTTAQGMVTATYLGCPSMGDFIIPVAATPQIAFPFSPVCLGDEIGLNSAPVQPTFVYNWVSSANDLAGQETSSNPLVTPLAQTTYSVTVTNFTTSGDACEPVIDQVTIDVFDTAQILTDPILATGCVGETVTLPLPADYNGGPNPIFTFTPQAGGPSITNTNPSVDITLTPDLVGESTFLIFISNDCEQNVMIGTAEITVVDNPLFVIICDTLSGGDDLFEGDMLNLTVSPITPGVTYTWSSQNGGNFNPNPGSSTVHSVTGTGEIIPMGATESDSIFVTATIEGCPDRDEEKEITFQPSNVQLPNIFTPGMNVNNIFRIRAPANVEIIDLVIYDRWGNKVYENDNIEQEWDGMINGDPAPSEVYIYTVMYQIPGQDPVTASSDLTLLR